MSLISILRLEKKFYINKKPIYLFKNLNLSIYEKEFLVILGPNGVGKTTLLNIIAGLEEPTNGKVVINKKELQKNMGIIFQEFSLFPWKTVIKNVLVGLEIKGINKKKANNLALKYLKLLNLLKFKNEYPYKLSAGMKQKVAVARALTVDPKILLMDEPFANLDVHTKKILQEEIIKLWKKKKKTVIYVTHDIEEALLMATRIVLLGKKGVIKKIIKIKDNSHRNLSSDYFYKINQEIKRRLI